MSGGVTKLQRFSFLRLILLNILLLCMIPTLFAQTHPDAKDLLRQMTLEEKVAQLSQLPGFPIPEFSPSKTANPKMPSANTAQDRSFGFPIRKRSTAGSTSPWMNPACTFPSCSDSM